MSVAPPPKLNFYGDKCQFVIKSVGLVGLVRSSVILSWLFQRLQFGTTG